MKVLDEGKWKSPWSVEAVCPEKCCGAKLLVDESDIKAVEYSSKNDFYAVCPVCSGHLSFGSSAIPARIARELNKKRKYSSGSSWD